MRNFSNKMAAKTSHLRNLSNKFKELTKILNLSNNDFIRTTEKRHFKSVEDLWNKLVKSGDIYLDKYKGWYSVSDEAYYDEDEIEENNGAKISKLSGSFLIRWLRERADLLFDRSVKAGICWLVPSGQLTRIACPFCIILISTGAIRKSAVSDCLVSLGYSKYGSILGFHLGIEFNTNWS